MMALSVSGLSMKSRGMVRPGAVMRNVAVRPRSSIVPRRKEVVMKSNARYFVGGNWKANGSLESVNALVKGLNNGTVPPNVDVVVAPPFIYLDLVRRNLRPPYEVAAQNCHVAGNGAYTGEITASMLKDMGIPWVILGHSERRSLFGEFSETVGKKCKVALETELNIIPCIGETLKERESGKLFDVLNEQMQALVDNISDWSGVVLAYEPVWAIGTGVVATPAQAQEVHAYLRKWLSAKIGTQVAEELPIIYGGSVNDANCAELASQEDIDGFLVGGASLKAASFVTICNAFNEVKK